jgi:hypothetical protein
VNRSARRSRARHSRQAEGDDGQEGSPGKLTIRAIQEDAEEKDDDLCSQQQHVEIEDDQGSSEMDDFSLDDSVDEAPRVPAGRTQALPFPDSSSSLSTGRDAVEGLPRHATLAEGDQYDPIHLMMQLYDLTVENRPQMLSDGPSLKLALSVLDRTPEYETHKIGLLYVRDEKQTSEPAILGNTGGSLRYLQFLRGLGTFTKLEGLPGYTGGLDTTNNSDGKFGLIYKDACAQVLRSFVQLLLVRLADIVSCGLIYRSCFM